MSPAKELAAKAVMKTKSGKAKKAVSKTKPYNDLDLSNWKEYDHILTDSLWMIPSRQKTGGHRLDYHGNFVPQIAHQMMLRYTKAGEIIVDYFLGSGTSAIEAHTLGRKAIGVELQPHMADYVQSKLDEMGACETCRVITGDSSDHDWTGKKVSQALQTFGEDKAHFAFLHPPYDDIIKFSSNDNDLSNQATTDEFLNKFELVAQQAYNHLAPGRFAALVIGDKYANSELVPLGFLCMERMNRAGFKTKSIIVKNMTGNEKGKGRTQNLWRYRALAGGFYLFKHEYVMVFQK